MTALLRMPALFRAFVFSSYFAVFITLLFLMVLRLTRLRRFRPCPVCVLLTPCAALITVFLMEGQRQISNGLTPLGLGASAWRLPWGFHALFLAGCVVYSCAGFLKEKLVAETEITPDSIREALDNLPGGLCFSGCDGLPLLVNRRMYELARDVDGGLLQNAEVFWQSLSDFSERNGAELLQGGPSPVLRRSNGSVWRFSKTKISVSGRQYIQTTAADITSLHELSERLAMSNDALQRQQKRLKKLIEGMIDIAREEEILAVKVHIHNELGRCVLAGRRSLEEPFAKRVEQALNLWREVASRLETSAADTTQNTAEALRQITALAALLGCAVEIEGELPQNEDVAYLLLTAVREAVTNAVRHAGASRVSVKLSQKDNALAARISDNGTGRPTKITEGSGLTSLRGRIQQAGGELNILCDKGVSLHLRLPLTREDEVTL